MLLLDINYIFYIYDLFIYVYLFVKFCKLIVQYYFQIEENCDLKYLSTNELLKSLFYDSNAEILLIFSTC